MSSPQNFALYHGEQLQALKADECRAVNRMERKEVLFQLGICGIVALLYETKKDLFFFFRNPFRYPLDRFSCDFLSHSSFS